MYPLFRRAFVFRSEGWAGNRDNVGVVDQAIDHGRSNHVIAKDAPPFFKRLTNGQDDGAMFVPPTDELEEEIGPPGIHGQIAELIEDQEVQSAEDSQAGAERMITVAAVNSSEEIGDGPKDHSLVRNARANADRDRKVRLPRTGGAEKQNMGLRGVVWVNGDPPRLPTGFPTP